MAQRKVEAANRRRHVSTVDFLERDLQRRERLAVEAAETLERKAEDLRRDADAILNKLILVSVFVFINRFSSFSGFYFVSDSQFEHLNHVHFHALLNQI